MNNQDKPLTYEEIGRMNERLADLNIPLHEWMVRRHADHYEVSREAMEKLLALSEYAALLVRSMAGDPCIFDHHGQCQNHDGIDPCPHPKLSEMLGL